MLSVNYFQIQPCCGSSPRTSETRLETQNELLSLSLTFSPSLSLSLSLSPFQSLSPPDLNLSLGTPLSPFLSHPQSLLLFFCFLSLSLSLSPWSEVAPPVAR